MRRSGDPGKEQRTRRPLEHPSTAPGMDPLTSSSIANMFKDHRRPGGLRHRLSTPLLTVKGQGETATKQPSSKQLVVPVDVGAPRVAVHGSRGQRRPRREAHVKEETRRRSRALPGDEGAPAPCTGQRAPRSEPRTDSVSGLQRFTQPGHSPSSGTRGRRAGP